jgi:hypothetical protein
MQEKEIHKLSDDITTILTEKGHVSPAVAELFKGSLETKSVKDLEELAEKVKGMEDGAIMKPVGKTDQTKKIGALTLDHPDVTPKMAQLHVQKKISLETLMKMDPEKIGELYKKIDTPEIQARASRVNPITGEVELEVST